jgi:hypothetical protein
MLSTQQIFTQACDSLRTYGNQYGSIMDRKWGWCNPQNPNERCAIARFISGSNDFEVRHNLTKEVITETYKANPVIVALTDLFDYSPEMCNNKQELENELKFIADKFKLAYVLPKQEIRTLETV